MSLSCHLLLLVVVLSALHAKALDIEHSLDGGLSWHRSHSSVELDSRKAEVEVERLPVDMEALKALASRDGFYLIRAKGRSHAMASVRASSFLSRGDAEVVDIHLSEDKDQVVALSLSVKGGPKPGSEIAELPTKSNVRFHLPEIGPMVTMPVPIATHGQGFPQGYPSQGAADYASGNPLNRQKGAPGGGSSPHASASEVSEGEGSSPPPAPPVEEKSWWQKNWLVIMGVGMAVVNLGLNALAKTTPPPNQRRRLPKPQ